jgi:8-oxo-dGTP pyrophosphatase MutT (NUDIX family)
MDFASFQIALKVLLKKDGEYLFLTDVNTGKLDLPGGRIDGAEYNTPLSEVIKREVGEELGNDLKYELGKPIFQFRARIKNDESYIFITVYEANYISGSIRLSSEHNKHHWIDIKGTKLQEGSFFNNEAYSAFKRYFEGINH